LKNLEIPVVFLRLFALPDEKIHRSYSKVLDDTDH